MTSPRDNHDMIELAPIAGGQEGIESARITRAQLVAVIRQRLEHLTAQIEAALKELGFAGPFGRQVVLTGGGAELKGIADYAQGVLGRAVRIGRPNLPGLPEAHSGPAFSTLAGLALFAASDERRPAAGRRSRAPRRKAPGNVAAAADCGFSDSVLRKSGENMTRTLTFRSHRRIASCKST